MKHCEGGYFGLTSAPACSSAGQSHLYPELTFGPQLTTQPQAALQAIGRRLGPELGLGQIKVRRVSSRGW